MEEKGGNCYPIGYYNMTWREMLAIVHKHMGCPNKKIVTIPNWMYTIGGKNLMKEQKKNNIEGGLHMVKFTALQCSNLFIDKSLGCEKLHVEADDIDAATRIPIGTAIAQSFNLQFAEKLGDIVGREMEMFGIDLWLAPALNIHRSILCGRNFEYYSEDPLVSGLMAAAIMRMC